VETALAHLPRTAPVVVFGGTFDPPHVGHLIVADDLFYAYQPSAVVFIPAAIAPHKTAVRREDAGHRVEMVRRAVGEDPHFAYATLELERGGLSYTIDTVDALKALGFTDVVVAIGADNLADLPTWRDWERLVTGSRLVAVSRPGYELTPARVPVAGGRIETLAVTPVPISSTLVRERVRKGAPFRYLVPGPVYEYILARGLYR